MPHENALPISSQAIEAAMNMAIETGLLPAAANAEQRQANLASMSAVLKAAISVENEQAIHIPSGRENELLELIKHIRGVSSCESVWDHIDEVVPYVD
jgi:hypothetical protein